MKTLDRFIVAGLHGKRTIDAKIQDNTLILVGENGSGKTTFLRILFHFLSGRWFALRQFKFDHITATVGGTTVKVTYEALSKSFERIDQRYLAAMPSGVRRRFMDWISTHGISEMPPDLEKWTHRIGVPWQAIVNQLQLFEENPKGPRKELQDSIQLVRGAIDAQILYLPTYRRIERELESIFEGIDLDDVRRGRARARASEVEDTFIELVEFGMKDVQQAIDNALSGLRDFARENLTTLTFRNLGDVVNREYLKVGMKEIAGVVSLFNHLYLSGKNRYFVLIDEPELSLSVPWQRRFLTDIRKGGFCEGLVAVTHSPFTRLVERYAR